MTKYLSFFSFFYNLKKIFRIKKIFWVITFSSLFLLLIVVSLTTLSALQQSSQTKAAAITTPPNTDQRTQIQGPKSNLILNKELSFPIKDDNGKEIGKVQFIVDSAELRDEIVVRGQKATSIKGKTFLVLNIRIKNENTKRLQMNTRDYVRLSLNNGPDLLAPDIHNDPVEVQASSVKQTRLGFAINDSDHNLKLLLGEISGEKTTIELNFP